MKQPSVWTLSEQTSLSVDLARVSDITFGYRRAFLERLENLPPSAWAEPSRCSDWTVHQVARHIADVSEKHTKALTWQGELSSPGDPFNPATTPTRWLLASSKESPAQTNMRLRQALEAEDQAVKAKAADQNSILQAGLTGRTWHWSLFSVHVFWDAWMHERDIALPLGYEPPLSADELRLATMYALLLAAGISGRKTLPTSIALAGAPDGSYSITSEDGDVTVSVGVQGPSQLQGEVTAVADGLAGRGPDLTELLKGEPEKIKRLGTLRSLM